MNWAKLLGAIDWKKVSVKKVSVNSLLGGLTVYGTLKGAGAPDNYAIAGGLLSALTSGVSAANDTSKDAAVPSTPTPQSEGEQPLG